MTITRFKLIKTDGELFGIGVSDMMVLGAAYSLIYAITLSFLFDAVLCVGIYVILRIFKILKPRGWLRDIFSYYVLRSPYYISHQTRQGVFYEIQ